MDSLEVKGKNENMALLVPMMHILDSKNITEGIKIVLENDKVYICLEKRWLSEVNKFILFKIAEVYSETMFYSDNSVSPSSDRSEYWNPDGAFPHVLEECMNKKFYVLELKRNDAFTILGTSIMLANCLQEQDPLQLDVNKDKNIYSLDEIARHDHYEANGCPDHKWLCFTIALDQNNPLRESPYAPFISVVQINTPVKCDNVISAVMVGYDVKTYISFNMDRKDLEETIRNHFNKTSDEPTKEVQEVLGDVKQKMLENK